MALFKKMESDSDRATAIIGGALIENELALAIMTRLRPLSEKYQKALFEDLSSVLGDFHGKIQIGFALNLYNEKVMHDLHNVRKVRNRFAHNFDVHLFDDTEISNLCAALHCPAYDASAYSKEESTTPKARFLDTIGHLGARFDLELSHVHRPPASSLISYDAPDA